MWPFENIYIRNVLARFSLMFITTYLTFCLLFVFPLSLGLEMAWVSLSWPETPCAWFSSCGLSLSPSLGLALFSPDPACHLGLLCLLVPLATFLGPAAEALVTDRLHHTI